MSKAYVTLESVKLMPLDEGEKIIGKVLPSERQLYLQMKNASTTSERRKLSKEFWSVINKRLNSKIDGQTCLGVREDWVIVVYIEWY